MSADTTIRTEVRLGSFTGEHELDRNPWTVLGTGTVVQPTGPASVDSPLWTAKAGAAQLTRDLTGLTPGATVYLSVSANFDPGWFQFNPYRLPFVQLGRPADPGGPVVRNVPTINPAGFTQAGEPEAVMLVPYVVPADGVLRVVLAGDQLDGNEGSRGGDTTFSGVRLLYGNVWTHTSDGRYPAPDPTAGQWLLDGYRHTWGLEDWPAQPTPATGGLTLAAVDPQLLPPMEIGTRASVKVLALTQPAGSGLQVSELARLEGRISDADAGPTMLPVVVAGELTEVAALQVQLTLVELTADLAESWVGAQPWPEEYPGQRLDRIMAAARPQLPWSGSGAALDVFDGFRALDVDHRSVADLVEEHFSQISQMGNLATNQDVGWERPIMWFDVAERTGRLMEWPLSLPGSHEFHIAKLTERNHYGGPLRLLQQGRQVNAVLSANPAVAGQAHGTIPADWVDLAVTWRRDKGRATNRATVGGDFAGLYGEVGPDLSYRVTQVEAEWPDLVARNGAVTVAKDSTLVYYHSAIRLAQMLQGDRAEGQGRWGCEAATIYVSELPDAVTLDQVAGDLFPIVYQELWGPTSPWGRPRVITGLQAAHQLDGQPYTAGQLMGAELVVGNGRAAITVQLRPVVDRQTHEYPFGWPTEPVPDGASYAMTYAHMGYRHPTATYRDNGVAPFIDPQLTYYQLRLVRSE